MTNNPSASDAVFNTVELLEEILLALPMKDILLNTRVCKTWKATIDSSIRLQQCLFYQPVDILEAEIKPSTDVRVATTVSRYTTSDGTVVAMPPVQNPLFTPQPNDKQDRWEAFFEGTVFKAALGIKRLDDLPTWDRPKASWRKMLMCQPAVRNMRIEYTTFNPIWDGVGMGYYDMNSRKGVTAGRVFNAVRKLRKPAGAGLLGHRLDISGRDRWRVGRGNRVVLEMADARVKRARVEDRKAS